jgi:GTP pyrophosphokinase
MEQHDSNALVAPAASAEYLPEPNAAALAEPLAASYEEEDKALIQRAYRNLLKSIKTPLNAADKDGIRAAFELAAEAHKKQRRKSGEPYITHPIEVARICVEEIGLGPTAIICALLHDVVEDTHVKIEEIEAKFGEKTARIVDGLTKLDSLHESESPQAENLSKVLRAMLFDVRVVLIKMADRLHNLRTIKSMKPEKQLKIAAETSSIYAPLAHRLGLYAIKTEFQDICLKITHSEEYRDIAEKLDQTRRARQQYINEFTKPVEAALQETGLEFRITGRPKSIYSIWNKIRTKHVQFEDIYDLFAIRVILNVPPAQEKLACWQVYSIVTDYYHPIAERLKDWITSTKSNGYESLHTTVVGPEGRYVEVQIRSERMDDIAERGFAAHWKYKGIKGPGIRTNTFETWLGQVRDSLENSESASAVEFLADFQTNLFAEEVQVLTPKGDIKVLPDGATALDFAFSIHSDIGCNCQAVKVNNRLERFNYVLRNGDQVQVITDKRQKPTEDWLKVVVTSKAKNRIRAALKEEKRDQAEFGKETLQRKLNAFKTPLEENCDMLVKFFGYANRLEFLSAIYLEQVDLSILSKRFRADGIYLVEKEEIKAPLLEKTEPQPDALNRSKAIQKAEVIINEEPGHYYQYSFASCCNPVQGDPIFGFVLAIGGVKIHRATCSNANNLLLNYSHRVLKAHWGNIAKTDFVTEIVVTGIDAGPGVIQQLTNCLADLGINIRSFSISGEAGYFEGRVLLVVINTDHLNRALLALKNFPWVSNAVRAD